MMGRQTRGKSRARLKTGRTNKQKAEKEVLDRLGAELGELSLTMKGVIANLEDQVLSLISHQVLLWRIVEDISKNCLVVSNGSIDRNWYEQQLVATSGLAKGLSRLAIQGAEQ